MEWMRKILSELCDAAVLTVSVGLFWTAVEVEQAGQRRCGLASTLKNPEYEHARLPAVRAAGGLEGGSALELANLVFSDSLTEAGIGLAAVNALLPEMPHGVDLPAEDYIARHGRQARVALVGHFPFVQALRAQVKDLWVLELNPGEGDLPASAAEQVVPRADILALTASTLINHTFEGLLALRKAGAKVLLLGPSTPLSPVLFEHGIDVLSGCVVEEPARVTALVRQGATFRQIRPHGVRLVTVERPPRPA